jgi:hypothetical protein
MIEELPVNRRPMILVAEVKFTDAVASGKFQHHVFCGTGAKKLEFRDCDFSYCLFEGAYFHGCTI